MTGRATPVVSGGTRRPVGVRSSHGLGRGDQGDRVPLHSTRPQTPSDRGRRASRRIGGLRCSSWRASWGSRRARLSILALNGLVHLLAVYGDLDGGRDPQSNLIAPDIHHGDDDVIADDDTFVAVSGQDQHLLGSFLLPTRPVTVPDHVARALGYHDGARLAWHWDGRTPLSFVLP